MRLNMKPFSLFLWLVVQALGILMQTSAALPPEAPNIIYVLADDLGYGDLGCYGQKILKTPHLDAMAHRGMRFTQHYAGSTVCAPSRSVLLTGYHTGHARIRGNDPSLLRPRDQTIAEILRDAGYITACMGKWGVGHPPPLNDPKMHGFDTFYGYINMYHAHNFYPQWLVADGKKVSLRNQVHEDYARPIEREGRGVASQKVDYAPALILNRALEFIEDHRSDRFFLYLPLNQPHANNEAGGDPRSNRNGMEVPTLKAFEEESWPDTEKGFAEMLRQIDAAMGEILQTLKRLGLEEQTLVLFSSDNGPHQEGGHRMSFFDSNGPLRGMKRDLYEGGIRVPLIACWSGRIPADTQSDLVCGFQDILPTLAEASGQTIELTDGISFLPTLLAEKTPQRQHTHLYWEFYERGGKRAIRKGFWKAVQHRFSEDPQGPVELYDLSVDLEESHDLSASHPTLVGELKRWMDASHQPRLDNGI